jgi:hypothetical protein
MPIDYHAEDFVGRARALTGGVGVDAVFDPMGSAHLKLSARAVRNGGTIVAFGYYEAANRGTGALRDILSQYLRLVLWSVPPGRKHVAFYDTRPTKRKHPDWYRDDLARLFALLAAGTLKPAIAARLPLEEAVIAHRKLEQAEVQGKLVLTPNPWSENRSLAGQAAAPGGALARRGRVGRAGRSASGGQELAGVWVDGLDGDLVAGAFQALDVVAGLAPGVHPLFVVTRAEVGVAGVGVG